MMRFDLIAGDLRQRHGDQRPRHDEGDEYECADEFADADGHDTAGTIATAFGITIWSARHQQANEVMTRTLPPPAIRHHAIGLWLWTVAALMVVTLIVGGATRLTESGLSIVEWKPVTGVVPPVSDTAWQAEFDKYKTIPQFRERNAAMTLSEFKLIYWWEWSHRVLARLIGAVFLLPFVCSSYGAAGSSPTWAFGSGPSSDWAPDLARSAGGWSRRA